MKNTVLALLLLAQPIWAFSQTQANYEQVVGRYMRYYNKNQPDSVIALYSDEWGEMKKKLCSKERIADLMKEFGKMKSYKFLELYNDGSGDGGGDGLAFFKIVCAKSTHIMGITLNKKNELLTFRFKTSSPHIDSLLKKNM